MLPLVPPDADYFSPYSGRDAHCGNPLLLSLDLLVQDGLLLQSDLPPEAPVADADFAKLVGGASPQTMFLTRKLKIQGSMAVALKTQSILAAARPKAKL